MSEEATISEEPSVEENTTEYSGVEEAASFLVGILRVRLIF